MAPIRIEKPLRGLCKARKPGWATGRRMGIVYRGSQFITKVCANLEVGAGHVHEWEQG
jgi:hypothetical protein